MQEKIKLIKSLISDKQNIVITVHKSPDGDAMGAALGLYNVLIQLGKTVHVISPNEYASFLQWMPGNDQVVVFTQQPEYAKRLTQQAELIFLLDFSKIDRLDTYAEFVQKSVAKKVMIDHHQDPDITVADVVFSDINACATSQIVFEILEKLDWKHLIDNCSAACLYTGIMTDSGSFKFSSTTEKTHHIIAQLIGKGAENAKIHDLVYDSFTANRIKLLGYCLSQKLDFHKECRAAVLSLTAEELQSYNAQKGDTEGFVNYALMVEDIIFAVFVADREGAIKLSLRSKGDFRVDEIAKKYFNGGGHKNAAGGSSNLSVEETVQKVKQIFQEYKNQLIQTKL